jgi:hypothetical protein
MPYSYKYTKGAKGESDVIDMRIVLMPEGMRSSAGNETVFSTHGTDRLPEGLKFTGTMYRDADPKLPLKPEKGASARKGSK